AEEGLEGLRAQYEIGRDVEVQPGGGRELPRALEDRLECRELEVDREPDAGGLGEDDVRRSAVREARQRLVAHDSPAREVYDRLEDGHERALRDRRADARDDGRLDTQHPELRPEDRRRDRRA